VNCFGSDDEGFVNLLMEIEIGDLYEDGGDSKVRELR
jgi:hypothetical protein